MALNLNDASTAGLTITGTTNVGVGGTINVSGSGTGGVIFTGVVTAGALNAGGLVIASTAAGVTLTAAAAGQISILGSSGIDNLRGSTAADAISAGGGNDFIDGNFGGDVMTGGAGTDTFGSLIAANDFALIGYGVGRSASTLTNAVAAGQTLTFGNNVIGTSNVDRVTDFVSGVDRMDVFTATTAPTSMIGVDGTTFGTTNVTYVAYGTYAAVTGLFTIAAVFDATNAKDALVSQGDGATAFNAAGNTSYVVVTGLNQALIATDFI